MVFVADLEAPVLHDGDRHHLRRVLRVRSGDPLTIADGTGRWRIARLGAEPEPAGPIEHVEPEPPALTIGFALVKGDRPELVVQKLTELGVDRIVPLRTDRTVVRWEGDKAARALERLRNVARAAAMQAHRPQLPVIADLGDLAELTVGAVAGGADAALADRDGAAPSLARPTVLVGPEGGWSDAERALRVPRVRLGPAVLRTETAAITAGAVLTALRAKLV